jgi:hypothetical protein
MADGRRAARCRQAVVGHRRVATTCARRTFSNRNVSSIYNITLVCLQSHAVLVVVNVQTLDVERHARSLLSAEFAAHGVELPGQYATARVEPSGERHVLLSGVHPGPTCVRRGRRLALQVYLLCVCGEFRVNMLLWSIRLCWLAATDIRRRSVC